MKTILRPSGERRRVIAAARGHFGVIDNSRSGFFSFGLVWYLVSGSQQFIRMLFIQTGTPNGNG